MSKKYDVKSECPQYCILSAKFYNLIMDKLLLKLEESGHGCCLQVRLLMQVTFYCYRAQYLICSL